MYNIRYEIATGKVTAISRVTAASSDNLSPIEGHEITTSETRPEFGCDEWLFYRGKGVFEAVKAPEADDNPEAEVEAEAETKPKKTVK